MEKIDDVFISHASDILADTNSGLSGSQIIKECNSYAIDFNVSIPITSPNFGKFGSIIPNKRTALYENLREFNGKQQFIIIKELCELLIFEGNKKAKELKEKLFQRYGKFSSGLEIIEQIPITGWERVDRSISEMANRLAVASAEEQYQAIGMLSRETLITIAQQVFDASKHKTLDGVEASTTDAKRMLEAYLQYELSSSSEKARKFAKSAVDFSNQLTHDRNATKLDASMCLVAVTSVANLIKTISEA